MTSVLTPLGLKDGALVHVDDVARGLQCGCVCPVCDGELVARKGDQKIHHFAHAKGENCAEAYETALHIAAKEALQEAHEIALPAVQVKFTSYRKAIEVAPARAYKLDSVCLEKRLGTMVPDVIAAVGDKKLLVEIRVTHAVDEEKLEKIRQLNLSTVEVNLSDIPRESSLAEVKRRVVGALDRKVWLHNAVAQRIHDSLVSSAQHHSRIDRGGALHIDGCPLPARVWRGKPYANLIDDCMECPYALAIGEGVSSVTCAAFVPASRARVDQLDGRAP